MNIIHDRQNTDNKDDVNSSLVWTIFIVFTSVNFALLERYIDYVESLPTAAFKLLGIIVLLWLIACSFFASFHFSTFAFSLFDLFRGHLAKRNYKSTPGAAVLYLCKDDFSERAFLSCLKQNYSNYRVYVLDDSVLAIEKIKVASICQEHADCVSLIRRDNPGAGFKAGNINNALKELPPDVRYICLIDADEIIPSNFVRETVAVCEANKSIAFVQASHKQYGLSKFGKQIGESIDLHWKYFFSARNTRGFVYTFGHGVTFRLDLIRGIGGFPEVVAEDIAVSAVLRQAGFRGYFAPDIVCNEETPASYAAFRRRNRKITKGTLQFLSDFYGRFFRMSNITATEKIDLFLASIVSLLPAAFFVFLVVTGLLSILGNLIQSIASDSSHAINSTVSIVPSEISILAFITIFSPLVYLVPNAMRSPFRTLVFVIRGATIHLSICFDTFRSAMEWLLTKRVEFHSTGEKEIGRKSDRGMQLDQQLGLLIIVISVLFGSPFLAAAGLSLAMVPRMVFRNLEGVLMSVLVVFPAVLTIGALFTVPEAAIAASGIFASVALAHH